MSNSLPPRIVNYIFATMDALYGARFADMWRHSNIDAVKQVWADRLGGFASQPQTIRAALISLEGKPFPPTLPEFITMCRDAARRIGKPRPLALTHQFSPEELEANRARIAKMRDTLAARMTTSNRSKQG